MMRQALLLDKQPRRDTVPVLLCCTTHLRTGCAWHYWNPDLICYQKPQQWARTLY